jgi:hypothetical protein
MFPLTPALSAYSAEVAPGYVGRAPGERGVIWGPMSGVCALLSELQFLQFFS